MTKLLLLLLAGGLFYIAYNNFAPELPQKVPGRSISAAPLKPISPETRAANGPRSFFASICGITGLGLVLLVLRLWEHS